MTLDEYLPFLVNTQPEAIIRAFALDDVNLSLLAAFGCKTGHLTYIVSKHLKGNLYNGINLTHNLIGNRGRAIKPYGFFCLGWQQTQ